MRSRKKYKWAVGLATPFFIAGFILFVCKGTDYYINMFWIATAMLFCAILLDINDWSKQGLDIDKNESKTIKRSFDDNTLLLVLFYGTLLWAILVIDRFNSEIMHNKYIIIIVFIMTLVFALLSYISVWIAKRDTATLLKKKK